MTTNHDDIIRAWSDRRKEFFIAKVTSLQSINEYGIMTVEVIRSFDNFTLFPIPIKNITRNFGDMDRDTFRDKFPEYTI